MSDLSAVTILGNLILANFDWTVSKTVLVLMLAQAAIVAVSLLAFVLITVYKKVLSKRKQNILVAYTAETVKERALIGLTLDTAVVKSKFTVGEPFDSNGLIVIADYNAEPSAENVTDFTVEPPDMSRPGRPSVTVRYGGFSASYTIEVEAARTCVGLTLGLENVRREFAVGEGFDCTGLTVHAHYDREPLTEEVFDYTVESPSTDTEGEKQVIIRHGDFAEYYNINVTAQKERHLIGIDLDLASVRTDFFVGDEFDSTGLAVIARYDAEPYAEPVTDFTVDTPDLSVKGMTNVVVHYLDFVQTYPVFVAEGRALVGITLDTSVVRREFAAGEEFNSVGLIVTADYDAEPYSEELSDYEVTAPDLTEEGEKEVTVSYLGKTASYTVTVVGSTLGVVEESSVRYDKSFTARLIQSSDDTKHWYTLLKNELLSYRKVKDRMSWKRETYRFGRECVAKFGFRGNTLCLFLPLDPAAYADTKYKVEDVSANRSFEETPCMYRIRNDRRVKRAAELIATVMERIGAERYERISEDYYLPYEGIHELVNEGLAKRIIVTGQSFGGTPQSEAEAEVAAARSSGPLVIEEESVEGGTLRYDRSFRAKVIQSDDDTKRFYSAIKNELLSYKKVHDRLSWKRETYKASGSPVAKIGFRGNTLCLFLPLDPAQFAETRYKVEDVSANKSGEDTPCLFRIKNEKRLRLSFDLIAQVMEERGLVRFDRPEEDYAEPYQDIVKLIEQGLVRRKITTKEAENAFFTKK